MPTINPALVPTIIPGSIFNEFTTDPTLNIRWLQPTDPVFYETLNRPLADIVLRQLIIAKALDQVQMDLGHNALYPFLVQPRVGHFSNIVNVPIGWIWDINASLPTKWENVRLSKIKRISGTNSATGAITGSLRLIFTASVQGTATETAILSADYRIDSPLSFQLIRMPIVPITEEALTLPAGESTTVAGHVIFRALDLTQVEANAFLQAMAPPADMTIDPSTGTYAHPAVYEIVDFVPSGTGDFSPVPIAHGTGMLTTGAWSPIPLLASDMQSWITSLNYPFDAQANLLSTTGIAIPIGLFREFDICAPAGDEPTGDTTGTFFPVWITRISKVATDVMQWFFATHNTVQGQASLAPVEFGSLQLSRNMVPGEIVDIDPVGNLQLQVGANSALFNQHFGRGHVVLSTLWSKSSPDVDNFFNVINQLVATPTETDFTQSATRVSSYGISRVPMFAPNAGQGQALVGSSMRFTPPVPPSDSNRFVTESDQGFGIQIDLEAQAGVSPNPAVERFGFTGGLAHRVVSLVIDATQITADPNFYPNVILPRLVALLGRSPAFGDFWYNGTRLLFFNGKAWVG